MVSSLHGQPITAQNLIHLACSWSYHLVTIVIDKETFCLILGKFKYQKEFEINVAIGKCFSNFLNKLSKAFLTIRTYGIFWLNNADLQGLMCQRGKLILHKTSNLLAFYLALSGADPTDKCGIHYSPLQMAAEQGAMRALKTAFECLPAGRKKNQAVLDSILLGVFQSSCYECVTGLGNLCQRCLGGDTAHPADATWTGVLDFLTELNYKPSKEYLESMKEFPGKRKLFAYYSSKLRGEEPKVIAEGPGLGRQPLSLMQPSSLSNFLSALGQFGDLPYSGRTLQKQLQSSKTILPKSATCENCKEREKKMMVCGQCRQAYYCSRECQKKNWKEHKKSCSPRRE